MAFAFAEGRRVTEEVRMSVQWHVGVGVTVTVTATATATADDY